MKKIIMSVLMLGFCLSAFANGGNEAAGSDTIGGEITVLTNRTDMVDKDFAEYKTRFEAKYPGTTVNFEAMADYSGIVKIRMNTKDYGDVLLIPDGVTPEQLGEFFEPLGEMDVLAESYQLVNEKSYGGITYGIPVSVNANGILYNKKVFAEAGIDELPDTPEEFLDALSLIKENTDAIPYYTNYASGWALNQWEAHRTSVAGDSAYVNSLAHMDDPFSPGKPHYIVYKLLHDIVANGLCEEDPMTTDWESSKGRIARGEIASMVLGSWAIPQVMAFAENTSDIGYMPFPYNNGGVVSANSGGDYKIAINIHSENKATARAWLDFFVDESGFAQTTGGIPPRKGSELPDTLKGFQEMGVVFISDDTAPEGEEGWVDEIDQLGEIGLWEDNFKARVVEAALGFGEETFDDVMNDLNERWKEARAEVVQ